METPLTRQTRPDVFEPKIAELYRHLFHNFASNDYDEVVPSEGFWRELFLLRPDKQRLYDILEPLTAHHLLHIHTYTQLFFKKCIEEAGSGISPRNENALENLTGFLCAVLTKRYTNPSTDVIEVLAGLDTIDKLITDLVQGLEAIIRQSTSITFRQKAVQTALAMVSGSYQTSLVTYFMNRDLFPALTKLTYETDQTVPEVLVLLGLLANHNRFESQNLYQNRLEDFVNDTTIKNLVEDFAQVSKSIRDKYVSVQDDALTPWSISSTLSMVGLRALTPEANKPAPPTEDEAKSLFGELPGPIASIILAVFSFVQANKIFASDLTSTTASDSNGEPPLATFLSSTSYLCHHGHRSSRCQNYATLSLLTIQLLIEDSILAKRLSSPDNKITVRLARQRPPHLPHVVGPRVPVAVILDICTDTLSHNLRKRLPIPLYSLSLTVLHRLVAHLDATKTRLTHHWPYLWGSLLSLLRFLTQYATDLSATLSPSQLRSDICTPLTTLLALCLSRGDNFLPDPASYDDLFYKLLEVSRVLPKFKEIYCPSAHSASSSLSASIATTRSTPNLGSPSSDSSVLLSGSTNALLSVTSHYQSLLASQSSKPHQSPAAVQKIIKEGYETLPEIGAGVVAAATSASATAATAAGVNGGAGGHVRAMDFGRWERWRQSEWKAEIKRILRSVVEDAREVALDAR